jgi:hypothetical protein
MSRNSRRFQHGIIDAGCDRQMISLSRREQLPGPLLAGGDHRRDAGRFHLAFFASMTAASGR